MIDFRTRNSISLGVLVWTVSLVPLTFLKRFSSYSSSMISTRPIPCRSVWVLFRFSSKLLINAYLRIGLLLVFYKAAYISVINFICFDSSAMSSNMLSSLNFCSTGSAWSGVCSCLDCWSLIFLMASWILSTIFNSIWSF